MDLVAALLYMHSRGFLHNDLKPSNVLLDEQGRVKLAGLGLARTFADCQANPQVWCDGLTCSVTQTLSCTDEPCPALELTSPGWQVKLQGC